MENTSSENGSLNSPATHMSETTLEKVQRLDFEHTERLMSNRQRGKIELIIGPMFASKSTELLRKINRLEISGKKVISVRFSADNRYSRDSIATHDK